MRGKLTAFNTGTGVIEAYRGRKLVDQIYEKAFPIMRQRGIEKCMLEVIEENHRAIRVYERIGFTKNRFLRCFKGAVEVLTLNDFEIEERDISEMIPTIQKYDEHYSWDYVLAAILQGKNEFKSFMASYDEGNEMGYFVMNKTSLFQIEAFDSSDLNKLITASASMLSPLKINNVDGNRIEVIEALSQAGLQNHVNQFEMTITL